MLEIYVPNNYLKYYVFKMPQLVPLMIPKCRNQINPSLKIRSTPTPTIVYLYRYSYVCRE